MFIYNTKKRRYEAAITVYADINNPVKWLRIKLKEHSLFLIHILRNSPTLNLTFSNANWIISK